MEIKKLEDIINQHFSLLPEFLRIELEGFLKPKEEENKKSTTFMKA